MRHTRLTKAFIGFMALAATATIANAVLHGGAWHPYLALTLLAVAIAASRMKVTIPGINGSMSVNLPFLMLSVLTLNATESILIACASSIVQTFPKDGSKLKPVRVLFNVSMMTFASGAAVSIAHLPVLQKLSWGSAQLSLVGATAAFFVGQTLPVSVIVGLTEGGAMRKIWTNIAQMSFPYYLLSAGVTSMVSSAGHYIGWLTALALFPVMFGIYRSYRLYFARAAQHLTPALAMAAAAGARS
jgi:hypothetical protein